MLSNYHNLWHLNPSMSILLESKEPRSLALKRVTNPIREETVTIKTTTTKTTTVMMTIMTTTMKTLETRSECNGTILFDCCANAKTKTWWIVPLMIYIVALSQQLKTLDMQWKMLRDSEDDLSMILCPSQFMALGEVTIYEGPSKSCCWHFYYK